MNSENKKISFGFSKLAKKSSVLPQPTKQEKPLELIDCLEGSEIKVKNAVEKVEKGPLIISIKGNANNLIHRIERESLKNKKIAVETEKEDTRLDSDLTIEELAARQLLREARNRLEQDKDTTKVHKLPLVDENAGVLDGEEPSIEDYESVPISDYGLAMLRGMGWKEGMCIGRNQSESVKPPEPELRPKGLGLGAQKMVNTVPKDVFDTNGKQLILAKGGFGKIIAGPHKGTFCEVQGLDEESGRIIVKINKTNEILTLNELFVTPISKNDYVLGSKVINNARYEEYKEKEVKNGSKKAYNSNSEDKNCGKGYSRVKKEFDRTAPHSSTISSNKQLVKEERESSSDERNTSERKHSGNSSKEKLIVRSKTKLKKQSSSRNRSLERKNYDKKYSHKKHSKDYSSEDSSSEDEYSNRKTSKHSKILDVTSGDSSFSEEDRHRSRSKKSKKCKRNRKVSSSDSDYSRKSKNKDKRKSSKSKSDRRSKSRHESTSENSKRHEKHRNKR